MTRARAGLVECATACIVPAFWSTLVPGLTSKQVRRGVRQPVRHAAARPSLTFTDPYATYGFHVVVPANSPVKSVEQFNDPKLSFSCMAGTVEEIYLKGLFPQVQVRGMVTNDVAAWIGEVGSPPAAPTRRSSTRARRALPKAKSSALERRLRVLNGEDAKLRDKRFDAMAQR